MRRSEPGHRAPVAIVARRWPGSVSSFSLGLKILWPHRTSETRAALARRGGSFPAVSKFTPANHLWAKPSLGSPRGLFADR